MSDFFEVLEGFFGFDFGFEAAGVGVTLALLCGVVACFLSLAN